MERLEKAIAAAHAQRLGLERALEEVQLALVDSQRSLHETLGRTADITCPPTPVLPRDDDDDHLHLTAHHRVLLSPVTTSMGGMSGAGGGGGGGGPSGPGPALSLLSPIAKSSMQSSPIAIPPLSLPALESPYYPSSSHFTTTLSATGKVLTTAPSDTFDSYTPHSPLTTTDFGGSDSPSPSAAAAVRKVDAALSLHRLQLARLHSEALAQTHDTLVTSTRVASDLAQVSVELYRDFAVSARRQNESTMLSRALSVPHLISMVLQYLALGERAPLQLVSKSFEAMCKSALSTLRVCSIQTDAGQVLAPGVLSYLHRHCPRLAELDVMPPASIVPAGSSSPTASPAPSPPSTGDPASLSPPSLSIDGPLADLFTHCTELTALRLHVGSHNLISDISILSLAENCSRLRELVIPESSRLTDAGLMAVAHASSDLRVLNLSRCSRISSVSVCEIAARCEFIRLLDLSRTAVTDSAVTIIGRCLAHLESLNVSWCRYISDSGLTALTDCHRLDTLNVSGLPITDVGITALASSCPLRHVDASRCRLLRDAGVTALASCPLLSLDVSGVSSISDTSIVAISKGCPQLRSLDVGWGPRVSDVAVASVASGCLHLESLNVSAAIDVTDSALLSLARSLRQLQKLVVAWCHNITDSGIAAIAGHCPLSKLSLVGCQRVTDSSLLTIARSCSSLQWLDVSRCASISSSGIAAVVESPAFHQLDVVS